MNSLTISDCSQTRCPLSSVKPSNNSSNFTDLIGTTIRNYQGFQISFKTLGGHVVCAVEKDDVTRENVTLVVLNEFSTEQLSLNPRLLTFDLFSRCVVLGEYGLVGGGGSQSKKSEEPPVSQTSNTQQYESSQSSSKQAFKKEKGKETVSLEKKSLSTDEIKDLEGANYAEFEKAYENGDAKKQVLYLTKLGELFLAKKDYLRDAHLFNQALAAARLYELNPDYQEPLFAKLEETETLFLLELGVNLENSEQGYTKGWRNRLVGIRLQIQQMVDRQEAPEQIQKITTELFQSLLVDLITNSIEKIKEPPPTAYAVVSFGSMARGEMSPYSDAEFGFVLEVDTKENREYFRKLSRFLELRIINFGESFYPIIRPRKIEGIRIEEQSLTPHGFSLDSGGIAPLGKQGVYELIGSPSHFASFQSPEWLQNNESEIALVNALAQGSYLTGKQVLVDQYRKNNEEFFSKKATSGKVLRQERSLTLLKGHLEEFRPWLAKDRIDLRGFDAKKDLYRPIQMII